MSYPLQIDNVTKTYGDFKAIDNVSLVIKEGEFFTLLGPSGCGKTTLLRMIAGFNSIDAGIIKFKDRIINKIPIYRRNIGMVFQNYAIFPHMSVFNNIAYGLRARKTPKTKIQERVTEVLKLVKMEEYKDRQPSQLSGGQQQRIALARAIVIQPDILLMDEPLSNLDAKLRIGMRKVIKKIHNSLNITTVYVTHDQEEALAISDRIAVMNGGQVQQVGTPINIYTRPKNVFVADFIGTSTFIDCSVTRKNGNMSVVSVLNKKELLLQLDSNYTGDAILAFRAQEAILGPPHEDEINGKIVFATFLGDIISYEIVLENNQSLIISEYLKDTDLQREIGDHVSIHFNTKRINLFSKNGVESLI